MLTEGTVGMLTEGTVGMLTEGTVGMLTEGTVGMLPEGTVGMLPEGTVGMLTEGVFLLLGCTRLKDRAGPRSNGLPEADDLRHDSSVTSLICSVVNASISSAGDALKTRLLVPPMLAMLVFTDNFSAPSMVAPRLVVVSP